MYFTMNSKKQHINPVTGHSVPDESFFCNGNILKEDDDNFYVVRPYPSDSEGTTVFPKSLWEVSV